MQELLSALGKLRSGVGLTGHTVAQHPVILELAGTTNGTAAAKAINDTLNSLGQTPQIVAACYALASREFLVGKDRAYRLRQACQVLGASPRSVYRYEAVGFQELAQYLIDHADTATTDDREAAQAYVDSTIDLKAVYELVLGLTEGQYALKREIDGLKVSMLHLNKKVGKLDLLGQSDEEGDQTGANYSSLLKRLETVAETLEKSEVNRAAGNRGHRHPR
jgi:hypothetical protein